MRTMARFIDLGDLDEEDAELIARLVERLRKSSPSRTEETEDDALERSAGAWKGLVDAEKLLHDIYASRRVAARPED